MEGVICTGLDQCYMDPDAGVSIKNWVRVSNLADIFLVGHANMPKATWNIQRYWPDAVKKRDMGTWVGWLGYLGYTGI